MPPGLKDVAARAGVSIKTVSNVVNGYVHVAPDTRARVQAAIDALGYGPNVAARQLRSGRSGVIALAVPELQSPYFAELAGLIVQAAERRSWTVLIDQTDGRADRERDLVAGLRRHAIDGLIFSPLGAGRRGAGRPRRHPDGAARRADLARPGRPRGDRQHRGRAPTPPGTWPGSAGAGSRRSARQDRPSAATAHQRLAGYHQALARGRAGRPSRGWSPRWTASTGRTAPRRWPGCWTGREPPDAVFCLQRPAGPGRAPDAADRGLRVPQTWR